MRMGENPTKFARHNSSSTRLRVKIPESITAVTIVYIPRTTDYYSDSLDILKASIDSVLNTIHEPFDLVVFDNGSCDVVVEYLLDCYRKNKIQLLYLSSENTKKLGAWNHIFGSCQSEYVYYFDSDILHEDGWFEKSKEVLDMFPEVGTVNAAPIPMKNDKIKEKTLSSTIKFANDREDVLVKEGVFSDYDWFYEFGESLGVDPNRYLDSAISKNQILCQKDDLKFFVQSWHAQFLTKGNVLRSFFPQSSDWASKSSDWSFDEMLNERGYLRLGIERPLIRHMGNVLSPSNIDKIRKNNNINLSSSFRKKESLLLKVLFKNKLARYILLKIHIFTFNMLHGL